MSKANGTLQKKDTFLQHVSLKNYKSIKDVEIDFKPGLNIIIGKNSSGKTNFLNALNAILKFNYNDLNDSESYMRLFFAENEIEIRAIDKGHIEENSRKRDLYNLFINHNMIFKIDGQKIEVDEYDEIKSILFDKNKFINDVMIRYGNYYKNDYYFISVPFSFVIVNNNRISRDLMSVASDHNKTEFIWSFFHQLYVSIASFYQNYFKINIQTEDLKKLIITESEKLLKYVNNLISKLTTIECIRINSDLNVVKDEDSKLTITNFYLEFLVEKSWLPYNLLSDGTQRLFYIISEVLSIDNNIFFENNDLNIVLLEEPELGIHPHQLHKLMQFIKEQSRQKQIILTTHSPQVLDVLEPDELDRIIICHSDPKNGTQLSHLTDKEIAKAKKYMQEEAFLSDYWRFSDLEPA